jgi:xylulokinase
VNGGAATEECVLAIDLGTSGPKVALVATSGAVVASGYEATRLILTDDGGVEQDPDDWWRAITTASRRMMTESGVAPARVIGVCCTAQWLGTVAVDGSGRHLMNSLIWMDARGAEYMHDVTGGRFVVQGYEPRKITRWIRVNGGAPGHSGKDPGAHILWIKHHRPDVYGATKTFLEPKDYLNLRLTGRAVASVDSIAGHFVTDNRDLNHVTYDDQLLRMSQLDRATLPELIRAVDIVGPLLPGAAEELGVPAGIDVVAGTADVHSATLGSGAIEDYRAHLYLGTSSWITCHVPFKKTDLRAAMASLPAAIPNRYFVGNDQETAGACLNWLRDNVLWPDDGLGGGPAPADAFRRIDALAATAPVGSGSVIFTPWLNGERTPVDDHNMRAAWFNQSLATTRADQVRAVLEGVAYNSHWLLDSVEKFVGRRLDPIRVIGGGAQSALWRQIHADVLDRTIELVADPHSANVRGAGFLGLVGLGRASFEELGRSVEIGDVTRPDPAATAVYRPLSEQFRTYYRRTKALHRHLNG